MRKNVASQHVAGQMNSRTDGSPLTTSASIFVTIDGGAQTAGGGTLAHEGNGHWDYAPTQAETNGNHVAFTFVHATGVNQTVNVYPVAFDPSDSVRMGLTALPNAAAGASGGLPTIDASLRVSANVTAITDGLLTAAKFAAGAFDAVWAVTARLLTAGTNIVLAKGTGITGFNDLSAAQVNTECDTALADVGVTTTITGRIDAAVSSRLASASYTTPLDAAGTRSAVGLALANLDTQLAAIDTKTTNLPSDPADQSLIIAATNQIRTDIAAIPAAPSAAAVRAEIDANSTKLDVAVGTRMATFVYTAPDNAAVAAIQAKTDSLTFTVAGKLDVNLLVVNGVTLQGAGAAGNKWRPA